MNVAQALKIIAMLMTKSEFELKEMLKRTDSPKIIAIIKETLKLRFPSK
jgi:hypothetical protein